MIRRLKIGSYKDQVLIIAYSSTLMLEEKYFEREGVASLRDHDFIVIGFHLINSPVLVKLSKQKPAPEERWKDFQWRFEAISNEVS